MAYVNLKKMPDPKTEYVANFNSLDGGINLSELEYRLKNDESPEMKNLLWREGVLCSRDGQTWVTEAAELGVGKTMYESPFHGYLVAHIGTKLYALDLSAASPAWAVLLDLNGNYGRGAFFLYYGELYYKAAGLYVAITYNSAATGLKLSAAHVAGYTPVIQINTDPDTGAGDLYQPENRIQAEKTVWYNAKSGVVDYHLPVVADSIVAVAVDGEATTEYSYSDGVVTFDTAPPVTTPATNNTVVITYSRANTDAMNSVMSCSYAATYGGTGDLCVVLGGCSAQPNAIFWNGSNVAMDPTYFPVGQYQLCGSVDDPVTGFGKQQSYLIVFQQNSVGRVKQDTTTVNDRLVVDMPYVAINDKIGCDLPYTIQLIDNNLVWANTKQGVHFLKDSSYAYENNIECISKKINGGPTKVGLLANLREGLSCSLDDNKRYWLCCAGKAWVWDYENTDYKNPSWYYMTDIHCIAFATELSTTHGLENIWHINTDGRLTKFLRSFMDYDGPIHKSYRFAAQFFGSYDRLKNVNSVIIAVRPDTNSYADLTYISDYETRKEIMGLSHIAWQLVPRNLTYRSLAGIGFGAAFRRRPMCRRVQHFAMQLENDTIGQDLSIVSAQIFYTYQGRLR